MQDPSGSKSLANQTPTFPFAFRQSHHWRVHSEVNFRLPKDLDLASDPFDPAPAESFEEMRSEDDFFSTYMDDFYECCLLRRESHLAFWFQFCPYPNQNDVLESRTGLGMVNAQSADSSPVFVQQATVIAVVTAAASIVVIIKGRGCALSSYPSSLFAGPRPVQGSVHKLLKGLSLLCLTVVTSLLEKDEVDPKQIGRLEVGILSKSIVLFTFSST
nr:transcription factor RF2b [Ipomoea batatas]